MSRLNTTSCWRSPSRCPCRSGASPRSTSRAIGTVTVESPQGTTSIDATMKQAGEKLTGTITSPMGAVDFTGKVIKDALNVSYTLDLQGNSIEFTMTGTVAGDSITGNLELRRPGRVPWTAKTQDSGVGCRLDAAACRGGCGRGPGDDDRLGWKPTDVTGKWDVTFNMARQSDARDRELHADGDKVTGTISSQAGEMPVAGTMTGSALKLEFKVETPQGEMADSDDRRSRRRPAHRQGAASPAWARRTGRPRAPSNLQLRHDKNYRVRCAGRFDSWSLVVAVASCERRWRRTSPSSSRPSSPTARSGTRA